MDSANLETVLQVVTILGSVIALVLAVLQIFDTCLDIGDKPRERRPRKKGRVNEN